MLNYCFWRRERPVQYFIWTYFRIFSYLCSSGFSNSDLKSGVFHFSSLFVSIYWWFWHLRWHYWCSRSLCTSVVGVVGDVAPATTSSLPGLVRSCYCNHCCWLWWCCNHLRWCNWSQKSRLLTQLLLNAPSVKISSVICIFLRDYEIEVLIFNGNHKIGISLEALFRMFILVIKIFFKC